MCDGRGQWPSPSILPSQLRICSDRVAYVYEVRETGGIAERKRSNAGEGVYVYADGDGESTKNDNDGRAKKVKIKLRRKCGRSQWVGFSEV